MGLRTFFLPELTEQQLTEMTNSLRVLFNLRFISSDKAQSAITIRAELPVLEAADHLIKSLTTGRPEVLLDMRVYAISSSLAARDWDCLTYSVHAVQYQPGPSRRSGRKRAERY